MLILLRFTLLSSVLFVMTTRSALAADTIFDASYLDQFSFAVGDTIKATEIADDLTGTTLNRNYTVNTVSATQITCDEDTSAGYSAWVSGGFISQVSDSNGVPYPTINLGVPGALRRRRDGLEPGRVGRRRAPVRPVAEEQEVAVVQHLMPVTDQRLTQSGDVPLEELAHYRI